MRRRFTAISALFAATLAVAPLATHACGPDSPCPVASGEYRIRMPADPAGKVGAVVFFHGYQGHAAGVMANGALKRQIDALGLALIAPDGRDRTWSFPGAPRQLRDEFAFVEQVMADALARFPIDPERILASGFSMGGSMVWSLACRMPDRFAGFAPIAGAFWRPLPDRCVGHDAADYAAPALFHVHGEMDRVVPLAGRSIRGIAHQGDVFKGVDVWLAPYARRPDPTSYAEGELTCRTWAGRLELCLHGGGHSIRMAWVARAWKRLERLEQWPR